MASYCLPRAKAWHSIKEESTSYNPETEVLVRSPLTVSKLSFHARVHGSAPIKNNGI